MEDDDKCVHVWAAFQMEPFTQDLVTNNVRWKKTGFRCSKVFCQKCMTVQPIFEKEPDTGM